jgi:hypothetical protein
MIVYRPFVGLSSPVPDPVAIDFRTVLYTVEKVFIWVQQIASLMYTGFEILPNYDRKFVNSPSTLCDPYISGTHRVHCKSFPGVSRNFKSWLSSKKVQTLPSVNENEVVKLVCTYSLQATSTNISLIQRQQKNWRLLVFMWWCFLTAIFGTFIDNNCTIVWSNLCSQ